MKLSITARLTITSAVLTALVLLPTGTALYLSLASEIRIESERSTELIARNLAFVAVYQWEENLMVEYKSGVAPLDTIGLDAEHWAMVRGNGTVVQSHGIFVNAAARRAVGESFLVDNDRAMYRVASVPLFEAPRDDIETLPEHLRAKAKELSPEGVFLRAKKEMGKKGMEIEIDMLETNHIVEIELNYETGEVNESEPDEFDKIVPGDLVALLVDLDVSDVGFVARQAYNGALIAVLQGLDSSGNPVRVAVNRVGERFVLDDDGKVVGPDADWRLWLVTAADASGELAATNRWLLSLALGTPVVWASIVLVGWYVTRRALSPVKRIVETVEHIELSRLEARLPVGTVQDELGRISSTINRMLDRIEAGYRRERRFTGDASHELRSPLARIIADIDVALSQEREGDEYRDALVRCRRYARGMERLVNSLLWLARFDSSSTQPQRRPFEIADLAARAVSSLPADEAERVQLDLRSDSPTIHVLGDADLIEVVLQNLLQNALRYSPPDDPVEVRLVSENGAAIVEVLDNGEGIPEGQLESVFSRFYRVDKSRSRDSGGFGLGLAIVDEIAQAHGFRVSLHNRPERGLVAAFSLPTCSPETPDARSI